MSAQHVHCTVFDDPTDVAVGQDHHRETEFDLVPWADPYIVSLFRELESSLQEADQPYPADGVRASALQPPRASAALAS